MSNYARAAYKYFRWNFERIEHMLAGEDEEKPVTRAQYEKKKPRRIISRGIQL